MGDPRTVTVRSVDDSSRWSLAGTCAASPTAARRGTLSPSPQTHTVSHTGARRRRWLEYAFSASLLISLAVRLLGTGHVELLWTLTQLMATTIFFGYLTEIYGVQYIVTVPEDEQLNFFGWKLRRVWKPKTLVRRVQIHLLGYVPYISCWYVLLHQYETTRVRLQDDFPEFLPQAVWGSFVAFTLFGLVQLFSQLDWGVLRYGPSLYWLGELTYVILSFAAKANMGFVVLVDVLLSDRFDDLLYLKRTNTC